MARYSRKTRWLRSFSRKDRPRLLILVIAVVAYTANSIVGPKLYPEYHLVVGAMIFTVTFFAWLVDAIVTSVRTRLRNRAKP
ncbi:MAG: hypothetical protein JSR66_34035 [Proteobacteria bacterium]|nr:hypothetical protein [Pseudomonadota bacterium]